MTLTATDLFCGAGGSSLGARAAGIELRMAANHWQTAIDVHQAHFPDAGHDIADISQADPRRYPRTNILLASPECTNHSQARGVSRKKQNPSLWDAPDPAAERSRATMWDVPRFAEQMRYDAIVTENVLEAAKWIGWRAWHVMMADLGYEHRVLSLNAMFHGVPQSRDRLYVVFWRKGMRAPNLDLELTAWCPTCEGWRTARQSWKNGRTVGRYRDQWIWACLTCAKEAHPPVRGAVDILDFDLPCQRIGDRKRSLAEKTRDRIWAGILRHWPDLFMTAGAGNVYETTPGNRSKPLTDPLPTQQTSVTGALVDPPAFLVNTAHGARLHDIDRPHPTVCASDDRCSLVVPLRRNGRARAGHQPIPTVAANGNHHALVMRNNSGGAEMVTPAVITLDEVLAGMSLADRDRIIDDCGFRMLEPYEVAAAMDFPVGYILCDLTKKVQVKLAGNGNPPAVERWIAGRVVEALEAA